VKPTEREGFNSSLHQLLPVNNDGSVTDRIREIEMLMKEKMSSIIYRDRRGEFFDDSESEGEEAGTEGLEEPANSIFNRYDHLFQNMVKRNPIPSKFPIMNCMITYDSAKVITVSKSEEYLYFVKMYCI
jgi:hypothetical protein